MLFLVGAGVWAIVKSDKAGAAIESFFALASFLGLIGFVLKILMAVFGVGLSKHPLSFCFIFSLNQKVIELFPNSICYLFVRYIKISFL